MFMLVSNEELGHGNTLDNCINMKKNGDRENDWKRQVDVTFLVFFGSKQKQDGKK